MASPEPLQAGERLDEFAARDSRALHARLDEMAQIQAGMLARLERVIAMLDEFSQRAEPLVAMAEKRAKRGALFMGGKGGS